MWHAFDLFPEELGVAPELRVGALPSRARLAYTEKVVRWFKPKPGHTYKQPVLDLGPGWEIEREAVANGRREIRCRYERTHSTNHALAGRLVCASDAWRSPLEWEFTQEFPRESASSLLPALTERGSWRNGAITRRAEAGSGSRPMTRTIPASRVLCVQAWLADFPTDLAFAPWSDDAVVMEDATLFTHGVAIEPIAERVRAHALGAGLRGFSVRYGGGLPLEFWVNEHGVVIYLCAGPTRVLVLEKVEALA